MTDPFEIYIPGISQDELMSVRNEFEKLAHIRAKHKQLGYFTAGSNVGDYYHVYKNDRKFIVAPCKVFKAVLEHTLPLATKMFPDSFGKNNSYLIIEALQKTVPTGFGLNDLISWLSRDKFAYIFEVFNDKVIGRILRLELFNKIDHDQNSPKKTVFTGGVMHVFKHFSYEGVPLSTQPSNNEISHPLKIIDLAIEAFFISDIKRVEDEKHPTSSLQSEIIYNSKTFNCIFYHETPTGHFYIKTMHPKKL